jgi:hypothetical protein
VSVNQPSLCASCRGPATRIWSVVGHSPLTGEPVTVSVPLCDCCSAPLSPYQLASNVSALAAAHPESEDR